MEKSLLSSPVSRFPPRRDFPLFPRHPAPSSRVLCPPPASKRYPVMRRPRDSVFSPQVDSPAFRGLAVRRSFSFPPLLPAPPPYLHFKLFSLPARRMLVERQRILGLQRFLFPIFSPSTPVPLTSFTLRFLPGWTIMVLSPIPRPLTSIFRLIPALVSLSSYRRAVDLLFAAPSLVPPSRRSPRFPTSTFLKILPSRDTAAIHPHRASAIRLAPRLLFSSHSRVLSKLISS